MPFKPDKAFLVRKNGKIGVAAGWRPEAIEDPPSEAVVPDLSPGNEALIKLELKMPHEPVSARVILDPNPVDREPCNYVREVFLRPRRRSGLPLCSGIAWEERDAEGPVFGLSGSGEVRSVGVPAKQVRAMKRVRSFAGCSFVALPFVLYGATLTVGPEGALYSDIQQALDAASDGDTVLILPGTYQVEEPLDPNRLHDPQDPSSPAVKNIVIRSAEGPQVTVVRMSSTPKDPDYASVFVFQSGESEHTVLEGLTMEGGTGIRREGYGNREQEGGAVLCRNHSSPKIIGCVIEGNEALHGGAIACRDSSAEIRNCVIGNNLQPGIFCVNSSVRIVGCKIEGQAMRRSSPGGGIRAELCDRLQIIDCEISGNEAQRGGGVFLLACKNCTLENCIIKENTAFGGTSCGGGIEFYSSTGIMTGCDIEGNSSPGGGGGIQLYDQSEVTLEDCKIVENYCHEVGGIDVERSRLKCMRCLIRGNLSMRRGGGVFLYDSTGEFFKCEIKENIAREPGGGAAVVCGYANFTECTISFNVGREGGGISVQGVGGFLVVQRCTIAGNAWAGIRFGSWSKGEVKNSIIWGNGGTSILAVPDSQPAVSYSCVEGERVWPGRGNINKDPQFCGWGEMEEVYVDPQGTGEGTGTQENPYRELSAAFSYSLALAQSSPCLTSGQFGERIGAATGLCGEPGVKKRTVYLAAGTYDLRGLTFSCNVSLEGAGPELTKLEYGVFGLQSGCSLEGVTITKGSLGALVIPRDQSPQVRNCTIEGNRAVEGILWISAGSPVFENCIIRNNFVSAQGVIACAEGASPLFKKCLIRRNAGDIMKSTNSSPTFVDCTIRDNGTRYGSEMVCREGTLLRCLRCLFLGNAGKLFDCEASQLELENCVIAGQRAGFVSLGEGSEALFSHCTITHNGIRGVQSVCRAAGASFRNCIIWKNGCWVPCPKRDGCMSSTDPTFEHEGEYDFNRWKEVENPWGREPFELADFVVVEPDLRLRPDSRR